MRARRVEQPEVRVAQPLALAVRARWESPYWYVVWTHTGGTPTMSCSFWTKKVWPLETSAMGNADRHANLARRLADAKLALELEDGAQRRSVVLKSAPPAGRRARVGVPQPAQRRATTRRARRRRASG